MLQPEIDELIKLAEIADEGGELAQGIIKRVADEDGIDIDGEESWLDLVEMIIEKATKSQQGQRRGEELESLFELVFELRDAVDVLVTDLDSIVARIRSYKSHREKADGTIKTKKGYTRKKPHI